MITWKILNMDYLPSHAGQTNVVKNVYWYCYDSNESNSYGHCYGNRQLDIDSLDSFTAWADLTEANVVQWVQDDINDKQPELMDEITRAIQHGIDNSLHQAFEVGVPW